MLPPVDHGAEITRDVAALAAGVSLAVISMWASRGWIDPETGQRRRLTVISRDRRGRPRYRYGDVLAAERATRQSGKSHRQCPGSEPAAA